MRIWNCRRHDAERKEVLKKHHSKMEEHTPHKIEPLALQSALPDNIVIVLDRQKHSLENTSNERRRTPYKLRHTCPGRIVKHVAEMDCPVEDH